jgi:homogentisate phytyltransferase/homogentisate geranylgeranyltransferase
VSPYLLATVGFSLLLGVSYSLPPLRLKRFAVGAAFCIIAVRGAIVNVGLFMYFANAVVLPPVLWFLTGFMLIMGLIIALCKDVPDTEGDRQFQIETFSLGWGREVVLNRSYQLLIALFAVGSGIALIFFSRWFALALAVCAVAVWRCLPPPNRQNQGEIASYYQAIWRLFYVSYLLFPLAIVPTPLG